MKKLLAICIAAVLLLASMSIGFAADKEYIAAVESWLGKKMPEVTAYITDGSIFRLSNTLKEKKLVLVNLWASWCGPCEKEFPDFQKVYEQYQDQFEIIALSLEQTDKLDTIREFAEGLGLTFPMGRDANYGLFKDLKLGSSYSIPTTFLVDRFGKVIYTHVGLIEDIKELTGLFDQYLSDDYTETIVAK